MSDELNAATHPVVGERQEATFHPDGRSAEWHAAIQAATMAVFDFATTAPGVKLIGCTPSMIAQVAASAALAASPAPEVLGYTVMRQDKMAHDGHYYRSIAASVRPDFESADNHRAYCEASVERIPERAGETYRVVQLVGVRGDGE